jgi:serpin B
MYVRKAKHTAGIEVDEEGTVAYAATVSTIEAWGAEAPEAPPVFRADHPFLFMIIDDITGTILFLGRVADPAKFTGRASSIEP